ncbi:hypothetical protein ACA910_021720 [Epithemia clementina (nom. ined.)]
MPRSPAVDNDSNGENPANNSASENYKKTASKLRQEALALETELRRQQQERQDLTRKANPQKQAYVKPTPKYQDMKDSFWVLSYLFASQPEPKNVKDEDRVQPPRFRGKLTLQFKADGYTDVVSHESDDALEIVKAWGWDVETSNDDGMDYLLFSIDVVLPGSDGKKERIYMQAKQVESSGEISLKDGTVTIKQDVTETGSRWGMFSPKGILAEFRYVGDFVARPSSLP